MKKILFMGDSITDAQRDRESDAYMGAGYATMVSGASYCGARRMSLARGACVLRRPRLLAQVAYSATYQALPSLPREDR